MRDHPHEEKRGVAVYATGLSKKMDGRILSSVGCYGVNSFRHVTPHARSRQGPTCAETGCRNLPVATRSCPYTDRPVGYQLQVSSAAFRNSGLLAGSHFPQKVLEDDDAVGSILRHADDRSLYMVTERRCESLSLGGIQSAHMGELQQPFGVMEGGMPWHEAPRRPI